MRAHTACIHAEDHVGSHCEGCGQPWPCDFSEALRIARVRADDMNLCNKDDDCHTKAEGIYLALDDIEWAISGEMVPA